MGSKDLFTKSAYFTGVTANREELTFISYVVQKAVIEVNEKGTTAAEADLMMGITFGLLFFLITRIIVMLLNMQCSILMTCN